MIYFGGLAGLAVLFVIIAIPNLLNLIGFALGLASGTQILTRKNYSFSKAVVLFLLINGLQLNGSKKKPARRHASQYSLALSLCY